MKKEFVKISKQNSVDAMELCQCCRADEKGTCTPGVVPSFARCGACGKVFCGEQGDVEACLCEKCSTEIVERGSGENTHLFQMMDVCRCLVGDDVCWMAPDGELVNVKAMWLTLESARRLTEQMELLLINKRENHGKRG